jgi:hypothetical protein
MENKNRYILLEIRDAISGERTLMEYIPETGEEKHDALPSEQLTPGREYYVTFTPVNPEPEEPFNKK